MCKNMASSYIQTGLVYFWNFVYEAAVGFMEGVSKWLQKTPLFHLELIPE